MSKVLYRKYRSQDFDQLIGQDHITKILKNAVKSGQLAQAYLLVGSRGTGKTSTARILAKAVNCLNIKEDGNPCGECSICKAVTDGQFLDLIEIDAASNRGIDQIRDLKEKIEFSPTEGKYKVYIIDEVHMLTTEAFNALLKTLEEPPAHVIFILATTDVHKLPPTILSRCQRYDFRLGNNKEIEKVLVEAAKGEDTKIEKDALEVLVQNAKGSYRDALSLLDVVYSGQLKDGNAKKITKKEVSDVLGIPDIDVVYLLVKNLLKGDGATSLDLLHDLEAKGSNLQQFASFVLETLRGVLTEKIRGNLSEKNSFAKDLTMRELMTLIRLFLDAEGKMKYANDQLLVLELIIPEMMKEEPIEDKQQIVNTDVKNKIDEVKEENIEEKEKKEKEKPKEEVKKESPKQAKKELKEQNKKEASEEDEEEEESSSDIPRAKGGASFDEIQKNWESFVKELKPFNGHLSAFMNSANLVSYSNEELEVEVPFDFYKDRIEIPKSREIISDVFSKMFGSRCKIVCSVNESIKPKKKSTPDFVLRNLPDQKKEAPKDNSNNGGGNNNFHKPRKISAEVEAIFEGM